MSSSEEKIAGAYLWGLAIILLSAFGLMVLITWVVDPLGILREDRGFPMLCADGIKTTNDRASIPLLPLKTDFNQAIIGTSRIKYGFIYETLHERPTSKAINLGINGLHIRELHQLLIPLIKSKKLDVLLVGLDFGMFASPKPSLTKIQKMSGYSNNHWWSYRIGTISFQAWHESIDILKRTQSCLQSIRDYGGFVIDIDSWDKKRSNHKSIQRQELRLLKRYLPAEHFQPGPYQHYLNLLKQLIEEAANHSIQLHLFINPSHPRFFEILQRTNNLDKYRQWELDLQELIQRSESKKAPLKFRNFSGLYPHIESMPLGCHDSFGPSCPFYDLVHYRPYVGQQILKAFQD
jgi:hypothetical protein